MLSSLASRLACLAIAIVAAGSAWAFDPQSSSPVNLGADGIGLKGYDPVAYFTSGAPTPGSPAITATYGGTVYRFADENNRDAFSASPQSYVPAYGGFCALAMSFGKKVDIDPMAWKIVGDVLYVQANPRAAEVWERDIPGNIDKADSFWPEVMDRAPGDL